MIANIILFMTGKPIKNEEEQVVPVSDVARELDPVEESILSNDQKEKSYYYDDSFGYKVFDPDEDDDDDDE